MYFKQFYLGCLAHGSYIIGSRGEAAVIDPQRDVAQYISEAEEAGLAIKYIIETHLHADFVSGHRELAAKTGAEIVFGKKAEALFPHRAVSNGDKLEIGDIDLLFYETPGHTPESICILARDKTDPAAPAKLFTGDTLFIGDVGRPDLVAARGISAREMAGMLYDSLHEKILTLADKTEIYPAHGAGSLCGKRLSDERSSTLGEQKKFNYALKPMDKETFIDIVSADQPEVPAYFPKDVEINRSGAEHLEDLAPLVPMNAQDVNKQIQRGAVLLDLRSGTEFASGHVRGSMNIGLSGQFASWAGTLIEIGTPLVLLANDPEELDEAVMRLARVGIETVVGYLKDGIMGWSDGGFEITQSPVVTVEELKLELDENEEITVVDVRRIGEYEDGHVPGAINIALAELPRRHGELPGDRQLAIICASGYRSSIAKSILEGAGFTRLMNVLGGTKAWINANYEVAGASTAKV